VSDTPDPARVVERERARSGIATDVVQQADQSRQVERLTILIRPEVRVRIDDHRTRGQEICKLIREITLRRDERVP
jgi:hypothetical protein